MFNLLSYKMSKHLWHLQTAVVLINMKKSVEVYSLLKDKACSSLRYLEEHKSTKKKKPCVLFNEIYYSSPDVWKMT